jgi:hypothetical protein
MKVNGLEVTQIEIVRENAQCETWDDPAIIAGIIDHALMIYNENNHAAEAFARLKPVNKRIISQ